MHVVPYWISTSKAIVDKYEALFTPLVQESHTICCKPNSIRFAKIVDCCDCQYTTMVVLALKVTSVRCAAALRCKFLHLESTTWLITCVCCRPFVRICCCAAAFAKLFPY